MGAGPFCRVEVAPGAGDGSGSDPHPAFGHPLPVAGARVESTRPRVGAGPFAVEVAPGGGLRLRLDLDRPKLSLCMIVRDNAKTLPACLESIRPWVDEMIVVDTGSVDETPRVVESFGGKLFHFPWCDDFSAARNESLRHATGDWLFWMDSDDTIPPECGRGLAGARRESEQPGGAGVCDAGALPWWTWRKAIATRMSPWSIT